MIFDHQGKYIPWGSVERVRVEPFIATAVLPSWMSIYNSAAETDKWSMGLATATVQHLQVDTPSTAGSFSVLNLNDNTGVPSSSGGKFGLDLMEIRLGLEGLYFSHDQTLCDFEFAFNTSTTRGVKMKSDSTGTYFEARNGGTLTRVDLQYDLMLNGEWARPRNIEFIARPDRWCVLLENGRVVGAHQFTAAQMAVGQIAPKPGLFNRVAGTTRWMRMAQVKLTLCH